MKLRLFQVDAFTDHVFSGNPAAICPLEEWLPEDRMQAIAAENNLSETAFFSPNGEGYDLRWFTPTTEADLCGHATLATAFVIWNQLSSDARTLLFHTRSGTLTVEKKDDLLVMNFPLLPATACRNPPQELLDGLGSRPQEIHSYMETEGAGNYLAVYDSEAEVRALQPNFPVLARLGGMGVIATGPGESADFASRYFAPGYGIDEDPSPVRSIARWLPTGPTGWARRNCTPGRFQPEVAICSVRSWTAGFRSPVTRFCSWKGHMEV